ncbi:MAG: FKBP-type peptidyl-prolyl cis-trans isomerase [Bdellovibrionota bacterium]
MQKNNSTFTSVRASMLGKAAVTATLVAGLLSVGCQKKLDTDEKRASYAIGQQIGKNLKSQNITVNSDIMAMSLTDAAKGESKLDEKQIQEAMMKLQENAQKKMTEEAEGNKKKGADYLAANKGKEGITTTASGLQYKILTAGSGRTPGKDDTVKVHYTGTLTDGTKFDSSVDRGQPAEFPVSGVIPGWTEALLLMKEGTKAQLFIPPELAYGPMGRPGIPPNSVLVFDVELISVTPKAAAAAPASPKGAAAPKK